jgi:hypothetical protein
MPTLVYDETSAMRNNLEEYAKEGITLLCPRCKSELIVALDVESIRKHQVHPGIYCSKYPNHFFEMFEIRRPS